MKTRIEQDGMLDNDLVSKHHEREVIRIPWTGLGMGMEGRIRKTRDRVLEPDLYQELVPPTVETLERVWRRHIVRQDAAVCPAVERYS